MTDIFERATYSPEDDKIRLYLDGRVPQEVWDELCGSSKRGVTGLGFRWAPKQGLLYAVWTPRREDAALKYCDDIEDEDVTLEERAQWRAERFSGYSENAGRRAERATQAGRDAVEGIPFGQPILVGHHSEGHHRRAVEKAQRQSSKAVEEFRRRDYWSWRAQASLRHAARKYNPRTIFNRIKKLKAAARKKKREREFNANDLAWARSRYIRDVLKKPYETGIADLTDSEREQIEQHIRERQERHAEWSDRWIAHLEHQIAFWEEIYAEVGGVAADRAKQNQKPLAVGGWVLPRWGTRGRWARITRINKGRDGSISSVTVDPKSFDPNDYRRKFVVKYPDITGYKADEEHQA